MHREAESAVADIVVASGGRLASRVRLQKIAYLLDQLGAKSGFVYSYHHYGPYSRDLDTAIFEAEADGLVEETFEHRKSDGARYSVFVAKHANGEPGFSYLADAALRERARRLASANVTVLELAATAHWLKQGEKFGDWRTEIIRRKGTKTASGRLEEALALLRELGLPPGAAMA
jgi:uncharacterized protein YwgA